MKCILLLLATLCGHTLAGQPMASFTASKLKVCSGTQVQFTNTSTGANACQWFLKNVPVAATTHCTLTIDVGDGIYQAVMLVARNTATGKADTATLVLEAMGPSHAMHLTGDFAYCVGDTIKLRAHKDATASTWTIDPPHPLIAGCFGCDSIQFVLEELGTLADLQSTYPGGCSQKTSFHYAWCNKPAVHVAEVTNGHARIYPNPTGGTVSVEPAPAKASLYNTTGQLLMTFHSPQQPLDISHLPAGVYFLQLSYANEAREQIRLVKE